MRVASFSKDQKYVAVGGAQSVVHILNATTFTLFKSITTNQGGVFDIDFRYDSKYMISCGFD